MMDFVIRTKDLTRDFGTVRAVNRLTMDLPRGTIFGFLGPNGSGKTTTIRLLLGLLEPTEGRAEVLGFDTQTHADEVRAQIGALLEHPGLYEQLSAEDNLELYGRIWRLPPKQRRDRIEELLTHLGLWERRKDLVGKWSRGMKQKLTIARVLLHRPPLIFLDEPTSGLDPIAAAALREDLAAMVAREGVTVFLTTHNLEEAEKFCHLVGMIQHGRLLALDSPNALRARMPTARITLVGQGFSDHLSNAIRARPDVIAVKQQDDCLSLQLSGAVNTAPLVGMAVDAGAQVKEVRLENASLEEVFLALMEDKS